MGKNKPAVINGLAYLVKKNVQVAVVVASKEKQSDFCGESLVEAAADLKIPKMTDTELYRRLERKEKYFSKNIDLVISFLFPKKIKKILIELPKIGCINFHPAPLPDFRGLGGYNIAIYKNINYWGVSAHFVDKTFDTGDIIEVIKFKINSRKETAISLEQKSQLYLFKLFKKIVKIAIKKRFFPRIPQGKGRYISKREYEELKIIKSTDTLAEIEKKIRAFWYPPYLGASIKLRGKQFTIINQQVLKEIEKKYHKS